jgi:hypothetical protein
MATSNGYTYYRYLVKADTVKGYTYCGGIYCPDCCPPSITGGADDPCPIFASDDYSGDCCDECGREVH